jgi:hypothetical protein
MQKINFKNLPSTDTAINATNLNLMQNNIENAIDSIANLICPVGKVEVFFDNQDHSNYLGFTWQRTSIGKFPIGIDSNDTDFDTIGETGGEKTHTLTTSEMPNHKHEGLSWIGNDNYNISLNTGSYYPDGYALQFQGTSDNVKISTNSTGGNQAHNNIPPYEVMAFWKRIS